MTSSFCFKTCPSSMVNSPLQKNKISGTSYRMYIIDLRCENGHDFEGWYDSRAEFDGLRDDDELSCPLCRSHDVRQLLSAAALVQSDSSTNTVEHSELPSLPLNDERNEALASTPPAMPFELQQALSKVLQHVHATHEDTGNDFARRAISMHRGEEAPVPIYGSSTSEDEERLQDEGVEFAKLPIPDIDVQ